MTAYKQPVMRYEDGVQNPRVAYASWLCLNFVPPEFWDELEKRLDRIQEQAVHQAARRLRDSGLPAAAALIDPGNGEGKLNGRFMEPHDQQGRHPVRGNQRRLPHLRYPRPDRERGRHDRDAGGMLRDDLVARLSRRPHEGTQPPRRETLP